MRHRGQAGTLKNVWSVLHYSSIQELFILCLPSVLGTVDVSVEKKTKTIDESPTYNKGDIIRKQLCWLINIIDGDKCSEEK